MVVGLLTIELHVAGAKDKRMALRRIKDRLTGIEF